YFGDLRTALKPALPEVKPAVLTTTVTIQHEERVGKLPQLRIGWHTPGFFKEGNAAADLLSVILASGRASRLEHRLITEKALGQSVRVNQQSLYQQSMFEVQVTGRPGVSTDVLLNEVDAELEDIRKNGVREEELTRARNRAQTAMVSGLQAVGGL